MTVPGSEVEDVALSSIQQVTNGADMRIGKIQDVNVVAHSRAVWRVIIGAKNPEAFPAT